MFITIRKKRKRLLYSKMNYINKNDSSITGLSFLFMTIVPLDMKNMLQGYP